MEITKIGNKFTTPTAGDDGEAVSKAHQKESRELQNRLQKEPQKKLQMPHDAGWYVAVVRCNCENIIAETINSDLKSNNIWFEYWVPMRKEVVIDRRSNKRKTKNKVLITTYVFCHVGKANLNTIRFRSDVYKMLTLPGQREIYRISDKELYNYRRLVENPDLPAVPCTGPLRKGQKVRITEGKMAGLEAYVQRISGKKALIGNEIKFICGATIEIDRSFLETVD